MKSSSKVVNAENCPNRGKASGCSGGSGSPHPYGKCLCGYPLDKNGKCTQMKSSSKDWETNKV